MTETKFAGPTMFSRGDTVHKNQHGALVARERSTAIRYLYDEAKKRGMYENQLGEVKRWTNAELDRGREAAPGVAGVQPDGRLTALRRGQGR